MKREYVAPAAEKVVFDYSDSVVASKNNLSPTNTGNTWGCDGPYCYEYNYWRDDNNGGLCKDPQ